MTRSWTSRRGLFAVDVKPWSVILAWHPGLWFFGVSVGLPVWWLPHCERHCVGWLLASVAWHHGPLHQMEASR